MNLQRADVELTPFQTERFLCVDAQVHQGQPIIGETGMRAPGDIAQNLAGFLQADGDAIVTEKRPQATHVTEQGAPRPESGHETRVSRSARRWRYALRLHLRQAQHSEADGRYCQRRLLAQPRGSTRTQCHNLNSRKNGHWLSKSARRETLWPALSDNARRSHLKAVDDDD